MPEERKEDQAQVLAKLDDTKRDLSQLMSEEAAAVKTHTSEEAAGVKAHTTKQHEETLEGLEYLAEQHDDFVESWEQEQAAAAERRVEDRKQKKAEQAAKKKERTELKESVDATRRFAAAGSGAS